jgi:hypothetical protein
VHVRPTHVQETALERESSSLTHAGRVTIDNSLRPRLGAPQGFLSAYRATVGDCPVGESRPWDRQFRIRRARVGIPERAQAMALISGTDLDRHNPDHPPGPLIGLAFAAEAAHTTTTRAFVLWLRRHLHPSPQQHARHAGHDRGGAARQRQPRPHAVAGMGGFLDHEAADAAGAADHQQVRGRSVSAVIGRSSFRWPRSTGHPGPGSARPRSRGGPRR